MTQDAPTPGDFERVAALFEQARGLSPEALDAWLAEETEGRPELRAQVERLLAHHGSTEAAVDHLGRTWRDEFDEASSIGPYRIVRELGAGGMGVVYLAEQSEPLKRSVALKVIRAGLRGRDVVSRFERERQTLARLVHPGIAQVYDAGSTEDGRPYVALEYVDGPSIHTYAREHALGLEERLALFVDVCRAVEFAHQKGVIHRDLKPGNVLVTEVDGRPVPKVIDFGIAKVVDDGGAALQELTELTAAGAVIGTPAYMSPEQALLGSGEVDTRADIYSLGVILYELLVTELPFDPKVLSSAGPVELRRIFVEDDPKPPSTRAREAGNIETRRFASRLEGDVDWITMKALAKERERRYSSAGAFADDIERYLSHEPIEARPPSRAYRLAKFAKRHRFGLTAAVVLLATLVAGLITSMTLFFDAEDARALAERRLADVERTADLQRLATLTAEAEELWPATPSRQGELEDWLVRADVVLARLPGYRARLEALRVKGVRTRRTAADEVVRALDLLRREELAKLRDLASYLPGSDMDPPPKALDPKPLAFFARHAFQLDSVPTRPLTYRLHAFDGALVYLNGEELARINLPQGDVTHETAALGVPPQETLRGTVDPARLVKGRNVLAMSIHLRERGQQRMQLTFDMDGPGGTHLVPIDAAWQVQDPAAVPLDSWWLPQTTVEWPTYAGPFGFTPVHRYPPHIRASSEHLRDELERVRARKQPLEAELARRFDWRFEDPEAQAEHDELDRLVHAFGVFMSDEPEGALDSVRRRAEAALDVLAVKTANLPGWARVAEDLSADERLVGFELKPQIGLIPLGKDLDSGLQEFAVWGSGAEPSRDEQGVLVHDLEHAAIVLVLIPGGTATIGATLPRPDGGAPPTGPFVDPMASRSEGPVHEVVLEPYFLSKYEVTQGQWLDLMGVNPSTWAVGRRAGGKTVTRRNPVESIPWAEVKRGLRRLGLVLPTEAQWEHAVRAGTATPWWCGPTKLSLEGNCNIADLSAINNRESWASKAWKNLDDGYVIHAPVGTFPANPWGLHETLGNVREWSLDRYGIYLAPVRPGDGLRMEFYAPDLIVTRGGSYSSRVIHSRVSSRGRTNADLAETWVGVRPARAVER